MKTILRLMFVSMLMMLATPAFSASFSFIHTCEQDDDATPQALNAIASKWLKAAREMKGGENLDIFLQFPVVAHMGEADFAFVITVPSLAEWGTFLDGYEGSALQDFDKEWDELAACPDSALFRSVKVE